MNTQTTEVELTFKTMAEVKAANNANGYYFFSPKTMRFFKSRLESTLLYGRYFITSEQYGEELRHYAIREVKSNDGNIINSPFPHARKFTSKQAAKDFLKVYHS